MSIISGISNEKNLKPKLQFQQSERLKVERGAKSNQLYQLTFRLAGAYTLD